METVYGATAAPARAPMGGTGAISARMHASEIERRRPLSALSRSLWNTGVSAASPSPAGGAGNQSTPIIADPSVAAFLGHDGEVQPSSSGSVQTRLEQKETKATKSESRA